MRLLPYGDRAVLVELGSTQEAMAYAAGLGALEPAGRGRLDLEQVVPAARTVLVVAGPGLGLGELRGLLAGVRPEVATHPERRPGSGELLEVPVTYDGPDLDEVGRLTGLGREGVVAAHTGQTWRVAFAGFVPGFGYLVGEDDRLHVPRRDEARTRVPAGAVGLAGPYAGVYPTASPGGWQLLGTTDLRLWDLERDPPALLRPGVRVRFVRRGVGQ